MSAEENMALVRRFLEARVRADLNAIEEMMAPDFISHGLLFPTKQPDREGYKRQVAEFVTAFSGVRFSHRGPGSRRRQGGEPHQRPRYPRSQGAYGHRAHRQGDSLHGHLHPPHIRG